MLLDKKTAIVYGAGGAIGGAVARAFAREGARVFLAGRRRESIEAVARDILAGDGAAEADQVDALDERAVEEHLSAVVEKRGTIDISFNAIGIPQPGLQGISLAELSVDSFMLPVVTYARAHFLTARAAARHMAGKRSGVILMHTPEPGRMGAPLVGGMGPAWAALEALMRDLSAEVASAGVRVACIRSTGIPETSTIDVVFGAHAKALGIGRDQFEAMVDGMSHTRRPTTLSELTGTAVFLASELAGGLTGTVVDLTAGKIAG
jgi:NAD(P)-dependent dehydrogenase (short-subunit alcohol dehydrogenase family)